MSNSVIIAEEIDMFRYQSEIQVRDEISSSTKRIWNSLSKYYPSDVVVFEYNLTRYSKIIDSVVFSYQKSVVVHRSKLCDGVDTLMLKVVEVTKEALRSMRAPDEYLPDTVAKIFDVVRSRAREINNSSEVSVNVDTSYYQVTMTSNDDDGGVSGQGSMSTDSGWGSLLKRLDDNDEVGEIYGFANPNGAAK